LKKRKLEKPMVWEVLAKWWSIYNTYPQIVDRIAKTVDKPVDYL
jgi:hypothetical protein